jgi:hypothetical protein
MWNSFCESCISAAMALGDVAKLADSLVTFSDIPQYLIASFSLGTLSPSLTFMV